MKRTIYDLVKQCLIEDARGRNSDKFLQFHVYSKLGLVKDSVLTWQSYREGPSFESIRRSRQQVQSEHPELEATTREVKRQRGQIEKSKGTWIFREEV